MQPVKVQGEAVQLEGSGLNLAQLLRDYWREAGFEITGGSVGGNRYWHASRVVLRCCLAGMDQEGVRRLVALLRASSCLSRCRYVARPTILPAE